MAIQILNNHQPSNKTKYISIIYFNYENIFHYKLKQVNVIRNNLLSEQGVLFQVNEFYFIIIARIIATGLVNKQINCLLCVFF